MNPSHRPLPRGSAASIGLGLVLVGLGIGSWLTGLDPILHRAMRFPGGAEARHWLVVFSALGGLAVLGPVAIAAAVALFVRRRRAEASWLVLTVASGRIFVELLKLVVMRPRPPVVDRLEIVKSWSFPSSHSAGAMLTCLALALLWGRRGGLYVALAAALAIGWSRIALAVHWPGDVLAGWGIGMAWIGVALRWLPQRPRSA